MMNDRADPDALLRVTAKEGLGRLKVYLGAAPGVGKTYEMLSDAATRRNAGLDVVVGVVETHGRADTEAKAQGFTVIPRQQIAWKGRNTEYIPNRFAAVIMRLMDPKTTALVFGSGKMVVTGAKSPEDSNLASRKYARIIEKIGFPVKFRDFNIQNIVGSCDVKFAIHLERL